VEITRQADYAVRAMIYLSEWSQDKRVSTAAISEAEDIPLPFLTKVISRLAMAGLVTTSRGMGGGVSLARPATEISLLQIVEAVDGPIVINRCLLRSNACDREPYCAAHDIWANIQDRLVEELGAVTMNDLAQRHAAKLEAYAHSN
jgi:Rrf2 family iron-sulfur cluster assembly transcriptional regulator